jgi:hypothetical protein
MGSRPQGIVPRDAPRQGEGDERSLSVDSNRKVAASRSDDELTRMLAILRRSDSLELKVTIADAHHLEVIRALELDPLNAQIRQVFYFDTPELALYNNGVVVRARRV